MKLLQRRTPFYDLFDRHVDTLVALSEELCEMFSKFDRLDERQAKVKDYEHACDKITHELATEMHGTFVTPLDKEDIAAMASGLDDIADYADAVAVRLTLYEIPESSPDAVELAATLVESVRVLRDAVKALRSGKERAKIIQCCRELHRLEKESDGIYRTALSKLFNAPNADPIMVLKWKEIYERLEMAVDQCEDVANVLESIQLKYS
jgi:uncharacterized protein